MIEYFKDRKLWLHPETVNMQKSFNGLLDLADNERLFAGDVFIFMNRRRKLLKALYWDDGGFCIFHKRLERGTFQDFSSEKSELTFLEFLQLINCCKPVYYQAI